MSTKVVEFFKKNDWKILIILAMLLTIFVSFRAGQSHERQLQDSDIKISINSLTAANPAQEDIRTLGDTLARKGIDAKDLSVDQNNNTADVPVNCALVGSKNSNKYHVPDCNYAKKIKTSNIVCFSSEDDALSKGYQKAKCCH